MLQLVGYLSFLKIGPKLLKFLPGNKARDLRNWLQIYGAHLCADTLLVPYFVKAPCTTQAQQDDIWRSSFQLPGCTAAYWNEGGMDNVVTMLLYLVDAYMKPTGIEAAAVQVTPPTGVHPLVESVPMKWQRVYSQMSLPCMCRRLRQMPVDICAELAGCLHPDHAGFFGSPAEYLQWYRQHGAVQDAAAPTVAVLLYRKHVITQQMYIEQLVRCMEAKGIRPIPIFINGGVLLLKFLYGAGSEGLLG